MKPIFCPTTLLDDQPSDEDSLGGSHSKLARAIAKLIENEKGGITIGLEGRWGSGKSTVINLISNYFNNPSSTKEFFISYFDAWAHEGDPLRRTFLERLIDQLVSKNWVDPIGWQKAKSVMIGKTSETEVETSPKFTNFGKYLLVFSIVFFPLGNAFINKGLNLGVSFSPKLPINSYFLIGLGFLMIPFLFLLFSIKAKKYNWKFLINILELDKTDDPWAILIQKYTTKTITHTIQTTNPTSVEFEHYFNLLIGEALKEQNHVIVLVLDNLDRISPDEALSILSTLQTFLQGNKDTMEGFDRLWVIIPYDPVGFSKLWQKDSSEKNQVAKSMIEKRFQIRFQVPPLVLSNWRAYFNIILAKVFPKHKFGEFNQCYRIYYLTKVKDYFAPTPRDIKNFVNQMGAIHRQWDNDFLPLAHIAYYIHLRQKYGDLKSISQAIIDGEIIENGIENFLGDDIKNHIVAMMFNTDVKIAQQLLLAQPIQKALYENNTQQLIKLHSNYPEGFWAVFDGEIIDDLFEIDSRTLALATLCIDNSELLDLASPETRSDIITSLQKSLSNFQSIDGINETIGEGLLCILKLRNNKNLAKHLFGLLSTINILSDDAPKYDLQILETAYQLATDYIKGISPIIKFLEESYYQNQSYPEKLSPKFDVITYFEFCSSLGKFDPDEKFWDMYSHSFSSEEITSFIVQLINSDFFATRHNKSIKVIQKKIDGVDWSSIVQVFQNKLSQSTVVHSSNYYEALWRINDFNPLAMDVLKTLSLNQGYTHNHLYNSVQNEDYKSSAWSFYIIMNTNQSLTYNPPNIFNSAQGSTVIKSLLESPDENIEIIQELIKIFCEFNGLVNWFELMSKFTESYMLMHEIINIAEGEEYFKTLFTAEQIIRDWKIVMTILEGSDDWDPFIKTAIKQLQIENIVITKQFSKELGTIYSSIVRSDLVKNNSFFTWIITNLNTMSREEWLGELRLENNCAELIVDLLGSKQKPKLGINFKDALVSHAKIVITGEITPDYLKEFWQELPKGLLPNPRKVLKKDLLDVLTNTPSINQNFFKFYGNEISAPALIKKDTLIVRKVFSNQIIEKRMAEGLIWLNEIIEKDPSFFENYSQQEDVDEMKERIKNEVKRELEDSAAESLKKMAMLLHINIEDDEREPNS